MHKRHIDENDRDSDEAHKKDAKLNITRVYPPHLIMRLRRGTLSD